MKLCNSGELCTIPQNVRWVDVASELLYSLPPGPLIYVFFLKGSSYFNSSYVDALCLTGMQKNTSMVRKFPELAICWFQVNAAY